MRQLLSKFRSFNLPVDGIAILREMEGKNVLAIGDRTIDINSCNFGYIRTSGIKRYRQGQRITGCDFVNDVTEELYLVLILDETKNSDAYLKAARQVLDSIDEVQITAIDINKESIQRAEAIPPSLRNLVRVSFTYTYQEVGDCDTGICEYVADVECGIEPCEGQSFCDRVLECLPEAVGDCTLEVSGCCVYEVEGIDLFANCFTVTFPEDLAFNEEGGGFNFFSVQANQFAFSNYPTLVNTTDEVSVGFTPTIEELLDALEANFNSQVFWNPTNPDVFTFERLPLGFKICYSGEEFLSTIRVTLSGANNQGFNPFQLDVNNEVFILGNTENLDLDVQFELNVPNNTFQVLINSEWINIPSEQIVNGTWTTTSCDTITEWRILDAEEQIVASGEVTATCEGGDETKPICTWLQEHQTAIEELQDAIPPIPSLQDVTNVGNFSDNDIEFGTGAGVYFANGSRVTEGTTDAGNGGNKGVALKCSVDYELKWEAGRLYIMEQNGFTIREVAHNFNIAATATDDNTKGYVIGSRWILDDGSVYVCTDATTGAAVWALQNPLSGYVPYTGATQDVDLGTHKLTADAIAFDLNPTNPPDNGQIVYDGASGALAYKMNGADVVSKIGQTMHAFVHNAEGVQINKGQAVYLFGASGNKASVKLAFNTSDATSAKTFGLAAENIGAGQNGFVITQGVLDGLNTGSYNAGDVLYLGATAGALTKVKPYAPNHMVYIGIVERANNGNGQIYVRVQNGYELDEIHDVDLITTPPANNDLLTYKTGANNLWKAQSLGTLLGGNTSQYVRGDASLATFPTIPTQVSQLTNDSGYQTAAQVSTAITNAKLVQVVGIDGAATALTGAQTNGILGSVQIPANSMTTNTIVEFEAFLRKAAASAAPTHRLWINNANNLTGATQIALQTGASGNLMSKMERTFKVTSTGLTIYPTTASANIDDNVANAAPTNVAVTWSQNQWIIHTANNAVGETTTNEFLFVKKSAP